MKGTNRLLAALVVLLAVGNVVQWRAPAPEGPEETIQRFADLWAERVGFYDQSRFLGVRTEQNPTDAWVTAEIIHEVEPDFIVEAGTLKGGSALFWAMVLEQVNPDGRVITNNPDGYLRRVRQEPEPRLGSTGAASGSE
jgi:cephalosporin hydroxylase